MEQRPPVTLLLAAGVQRHSLPWFDRPSFDRRTLSMPSKLLINSLCPAVNVLMYFQPEGLSDLVPSISAACLQPHKILQVCQALLCNVHVCRLGSTCQGGHTKLTTHAAGQAVAAPVLVGVPARR